MTNMEKVEERIERLGAVKGVTTGRQTESQAKYRASRYGALTAFKWRADNATHELHMETEVAGKHIDVYVEPEEMIDTLRKLGWLE